MEKLSENQSVVNRGILLLDINKLDAFREARKKQEELVETNPFVAIQDTKSYEEAKRRRTALRQGRFDLQNGLKVIKDRLNAFKSEAETFTNDLIQITKPAEDRQQEEINCYEQEKQRQKEEAERKEKERIESIKNSIIDFRNYSNQSITNATLNAIGGIIEDIKDKKLECFEFQDDFSAVKTQLLGIAEQRKTALQKEEDLKIQQQILQRERVRGIELKKYGYIYPSDNLGELSETEFLEVRNNAKLEYEHQEAEKRRIAEEEKRRREDQETKEKALAQKEAELKAEKERIEKRSGGQPIEKPKPETTKKTVHREADKQKMIESLCELALPEPPIITKEMKKEWESIRESFRHFVSGQVDIINNL